MQVPSLADLAGGAVAERFEDELSRLVVNILDPNTEAEATRTLTLKLTLKPSETRDFCAATVAVTANLAPASRIATRLFLAQGADGPIAAEQHPKQMRLTFDALTGEVLPAPPAGVPQEETHGTA